MSYTMGEMLEQLEDYQPEFVRFEYNMQIVLGRWGNDVYVGNLLGNQWKPDDTPTRWQVVRHREHPDREPLVDYEDGWVIVRLSTLLLSVDNDEQAPARIREVLDNPLELGMLEQVLADADGEQEAAS